MQTNAPEITAGESAAISGGDVPATPAPPSTQDVRKRWPVLAVALLAGLGGAFAIGSAVKTSSAPVQPAPIGPIVPPSSQNMKITRLVAARAVPALDAPATRPKKPKPQTASTSTTTTTPPVQPSTTQTTPPPQTQATPPPQTQATPPPQTHSSPSPNPQNGVSHGGGGGG